MKPFLICLLLRNFSWARIAQVHLYNGKTKSVFVHGLTSENLYVSPLKNRSKKIPIPRAQVESVVEEHLCFDMSRGYFDPASPRWNLKAQLEDEKKHPWIELQLKSGRTTETQFFSFAKDTLYTAGHLKTGQLRLLGFHKKTFKNIRFKSLNKYLNLSSSEFDIKDAKAQLLTPYAKISLETQPNEATVFFNGFEVGLAPIKIDSILPGEHILETRSETINAPFYAKKKLILTDWDDLEVSMALVKESPSLLLTSTPPGAEVYFGSHPNLKEASPNTTPFKSSIQSGAQRVTLFHPNYQDSSYIINVTPIQPTNLHFELTHLPIDQAATKRHEEILSARKKAALFKGSQTIIIPLVASSLFFHLQSSIHRNKASSLHEKLKAPKSEGGIQQHSTLVKNHKEYALARNDEIIAWSLLTLALGFEIISYSFWF